jgi:hypothetical protein
MTNDHPPRLGSYQAVAEILDTSRQAVYNRWQKYQKRQSKKPRRSDFPLPYIVTTDGPFWNLDEVEEYARRHKLGRFHEE